MLSLRTEDGEKFYQEQKSKRDKNFCFLCEKDLMRKEFKYWYICENRYPYTTIAETHDLLAIKRHVKTLEEMTQEESLEMLSILFQLNKQADYDYIQYNIPHRQSAPFHFHLHLIKIK